MDALNATLPNPVPAPRHRLGTPRSYLVAIVALLLAFLIRRLLDPWLGEKLPFVCFFLAVTFTAWSCGSGPSVLVLAGGWFFSDWFFISPRGSFDIPRDATLLSGFSYFLAGSVTIYFSRSMHLARDRADQNAATARWNQTLLEQEVADRKRIEAEVRRLNSELENRVEERTAELRNVNEDLESFTYSVSHDLRAPLRHMEGYAQILENQFTSQLTPEAARCVRKIRQASQNMNRLVDDLLNLSGIARQELNRRAVALDELVPQIIAEVQGEAGDRQIEWRVGKLPTIHGDPGLVRQALINLLSNAVKYTRPRERAEIEISGADAAGGQVICVRDNGVGFDMAHAENLFGVFHRLHPASAFEGAGVGLATVARIVRRHGGRIWAEAEVDRGAAFYFTLEPAPEPGHAGG